jgi:hypothetical protein
MIAVLFEALLAHHKAACTGQAICQLLALLLQLWSWLLTIQRQES